MSDFNKLFDGFMKQGQDMAEKLGKDFAKNQSSWTDQIKGLMPEGVAENMQNMMGEGLDIKTRALLTVAGQTAKGAEDAAAVTAAIKGAQAAGASNREITEAILQMTAVGAVTGVPKAMMLAMAAFATDGGNT
jgi:4-carboxymuconolactone decarboxylase